MDPYPSTVQSSVIPEIVCVDVSKIPKPGVRSRSDPLVVREVWTIDLGALQKFANLAFIIF
jgi:hypothetical protein